MNEKDMKEKEIAAFLKKARQTPSPQAVSRCIASLPEIRKGSRLLPLVRLQLVSMPAGVYGLALAAAVFQIILAACLQPVDALVATGISSAIVALLFGWHLMLSCAGSMAEMEKCCKYSYGQLLLARALCLGGLTLTSLLAAAVPGAGISHMGFVFILAATLPTLTGALAALLWANYMGNSDFAQMTVYLVFALITGLMLERIAESGIFPTFAILLIAVAVLYMQTKTLTNRRLNYEAYNY